MKKFYLREEERNEEEKRTGKASYKSIIDRYVDDLVLCNNIAEADSTIWDNFNIELSENEEIYQYYLCNIGQFDHDILTEYGILLTYSELLDCDVLCVTHWGTSWDYVSTDIELTDNWDEV